MRLILFFSVFLNIFFIIGILVLILKFKKRDMEYFSLNSYIKKLINIVSQVRYGNFKTKTENGFNKITNELSENLNSMFESISDRDAMIQEYILKEKEAGIMKTDFVATLTHDLKVPIIAQDKTFDLFLNNKFGDLSEMQQQAIQNLKISNMDMKYLVEALLETYKIEQTKIELKVEHGVKLASKIEEFISQIEPVALAHNKKINYYKIDDGIDSDITVDMDVFLIKRVVQNLVLNALSHSQNSDFVDISLGVDAHNFTINVKDYGCGIEQEEIKKIFNKYYSGTSKFMKSGVGLGLYLSNKIVKSHFGRIEVMSALNEGSTFSIILPKKITP